MKGNSFSYVILLISLTVVSCEFYSSVHEVTKLVDLERLLLGKMERFVTLNENKLDYIKEKLYEFEREREDAIESGEEYFENPINKYLLTKRLSLDWEKLENFLDHEVGTSILKSIDKFRSNYTFPEEDDFNGAIEGILRLQNVYRLKAKDIAQGILNGVKYSTELSPKDCFDFGKVALKENNLLAAHAWFTEALESFDSFEANVFDGKFEKPDILEPLADVKFKLSDFNGAADMSYALNLWRPNNTRLLDLYNYYSQYAYSSTSYKVETEHEAIPSDLDTVDPHLAYEFTCNGRIHHSASNERPLRCTYLTETHPFLLLAPIKVEELFEDPLLLVFHDVIYDSEIERLIELADDKIQRSSLFDSNGPKVSKIRTSHSAFFPKETDKIFEIIDQRVADMTGLNMAVAEYHQVANYGIGGHYGPHCDFFFKVTEEASNSELGNRMATVLFYLTDVEQGGGTAFPYMKRLIKPKKGSAAFWYNLHASGDGDNWTMHGACPVLVGSKWVLNRWIRERGQEFIRPCDLHSDTISVSLKF